MEFANVMKYVTGSMISQEYTHQVSQAIAPPWTDSIANPAHRSPLILASERASILAFIWGKNKWLLVVSVQFSQLCPTLRPHESQHGRPPCPSPTPRVHSDWRPSSQWCHPAISSSVVPFSSCPQSLPASESFPMSHIFLSPLSCLYSILSPSSLLWTTDNYNKMLRKIESSYLNV